MHWWRQSPEADSAPGVDSIILMSRSYDCVFHCLKESRFFHLLIGFQYEMKYLYTHTLTYIYDPYLSFISSADSSLSTWFFFLHWVNTFIESPYEAGTELGCGLLWQPYQSNKLAVGPRSLYPCAHTVVLLLDFYLFPRARSQHWWNGMTLVVAWHVLLYEQVWFGNHYLDPTKSSL